MPVSADVHGSDVASDVASGHSSFSHSAAAAGLPSVLATPLLAHPIVPLGVEPPQDSQLAAQTTPLPTPPTAPLGVEPPGLQVMQFPLLPAPPFPSISMDSYPSTHQDRLSGRPNATGQPGNRSDSGRGTIGSGMGHQSARKELHKGAGSGIEPHRGARSPHTGTGFGMRGSGMGVDLEEGLFDRAGLSTDDRVAAYLAAEAAEGLGGGRGVAERGGRGMAERGGRGVAGRGGKRAAAGGGEAVKPKKRKRI